MQPLRVLRYYALRLKRLPGDPRALARGAAIGVFVGFTPTMPLQSVVILFLALVTRSSGIAGIISSCIINNPVTFLPIYYLAAVIGNQVTPYQVDPEELLPLLNLLLSANTHFESLSVLGDIGLRTFIVMGVGGLCLALPPGLLSYSLILPVFKKITDRRTSRPVAERVSCPSIFQKK
jgi:uncharacterized protein